MDVNLYLRGEGN